MSAQTRAVIGADPGDTVGFAVLYVVEGRLVGNELAQRRATEAPAFLGELLDRDAGVHRLAIERYVVRRRAGRVKARPGEVTRAVTFELILAARERRVPVTERSANEVKSWATNDRLRAAGLYREGLDHGRDAARHALFEAVARGLLSDPMEVL